MIYCTVDTCPHGKVDLCCASCELNEECHSVCNIVINFEKEEILNICEEAIEGD